MKKDKKIKILHIVYSFNVGGIESLLVDLLNRLDKNKFEVSLIVLDKDKTHLTDQLTDVDIHLLPFKHSNFRSFKSLYFSAKNLSELITRLEPEIVHYHLDPIDFFLTTVATSLTPTRVIQVRTIHTTSIVLNRKKGLKNRIKMTLDRLGMAISKPHLISISKTVYNNNLKHYSSLSSSNTLIYNGIDLNKFNLDVRNKQKQRLRNKFDRLSVVYAARFSAGKNHKFLIDVWSDVIKEVPEVVLYLAGEGDLIDECKTKVELLKLNDNIKFLGSVLNVPELLGSADLAVFPSSFEGFSIVLLEKLAMGLSVIASDIEPFKEVIENGKDGYLISLSNQRQYVDTIISLLKSPTNRDLISINARIKAERFSIEKTVVEHESFYLEIVNDKIAY